MLIAISPQSIDSLIDVGADSDRVLIVSEAPSPSVDCLSLIVGEVICLKIPELQHQSLIRIESQTTESI